MNQVKKALQQLFQTHRLLFWYDERGELRAEYGALQLPGVEKVLVDGNEFAVKHRVAREAPEGRFLLYFPGPQPAPADNWLLDLQLAHYVFHTDQAAMFLQEMGLPYHFRELVEEHIEFFLNKERRGRLKGLLQEGDTHRSLRYKMLAVLFAVEYINLEAFLQAHAADFFGGGARCDHELKRFGLWGFYWGEVAAKYRYKAEEPGIYGFLLEAFAVNFPPLGRANISQESRILLSIWKDSLSNKASFRGLSEQIAKGLGVQRALEEAELNQLLDEDLFELIDRRILSELARLVETEGVSPERLGQMVKRRENKFWYEDYRHYYACLSHGSALAGLVRQYGRASFESFGQGLQLYAEELFRADYHYRRFIWHYRQAHQPGLLAGLCDKVLKVYANDWLPGINDRWQQVVDRLEEWPVNNPLCQRRFFEREARPLAQERKRLFVIISDALRYECGWELLQEIQSEKRYEGQLEYRFTGLPSYTQLGMAALLPHRELSIRPGGDSILADGLPTQGLQARAKVLEAHAGLRAAAIAAEDFMKLTPSTDGREFVKQYGLIYIYHNRIDKTGDDKMSEEKVFEAVQEELAFLKEMVRRIANMNGANIYITADHGFLYQYQALEESDFSTSAFSGEVWKESRRYVIGKNLKGDAAARHFTLSQAGLSGEGELLIPKSVNRLRIRGAGSRYVHGGAALQELVVPLLKVAVRRRDTTSQVEVDIIKSTDRIANNILPVSFLQSGLATDKMLPRTIRAALFAEDGARLSDVFQYHFDIPEGSERQREVKHRFQLSAWASGEYNNQRIRLKLEEPIENTSQWKEYKTFYYTLHIAYTRDFDDF